MFMDSLAKTLDNEISITENGAKGYKTTGKKLLDLNFSVTSLRNLNEDTVFFKFREAFYEDRLLSMKWLFFAADVREGMGERRLLRIILKNLAKSDKDICKAVLHLVPEYSRWDNLWVLLDTDLKDDVIKLISLKLKEDFEHLSKNEPISLLAKWLPSANASSSRTRHYAHIIIKGLSYSESHYRKMLSVMRKYLDVVEIKMSSKHWSDIDYQTVPSRANLIYNKAFLRNDESRRRAYLESLKNREAKINAGVLFPHDIVHKYLPNIYFDSRLYIVEYNETIEQLWKALPDFVGSQQNTICVCDGSGSMSNTIKNSNITARTIAVALSIYFAERSLGQFKDKFITFSRKPKLFDLSNGKSLKEKLEIALSYNEVSNTNIEAVFDLILKTAIDNHLSQDDLPANILILSDMEFDSCAEANDSFLSSSKDITLFDVIRKRYENAGYRLPRMIFWNILSRTITVPVKENAFGVALVSGFSPAIMKMVLSNKTDPFECLLEQLNADRYNAVYESLKEII